MRLLAISDLHLGYAANRAALSAMADHRNDWLILCGDIGETVEHLKFAFETLAKKFKQLVWVPGNHELWTDPQHPEVRGEAKYLQMIELARTYNVLTPEDPFAKLKLQEKTYYIAPLFNLYDYTFGPNGLTPAQAIDWAMEQDIFCADEAYLHSDPYPTKEAWCHALFKKSKAKLDALDRNIPVVLINHFPLRHDLVNIPAVPRFSIWCGTKQTEKWHTQYNVEVVVSGHLHLRSTKWRDGIRFEEVSLGYPRQWSESLGMNPYLCEILPFSGEAATSDVYYGKRGRTKF